MLASSPNSSQGSSSAESLDRSIVADAIARFVGDSLPGVAVGLGFLYVLFTFSHYILLPPTHKLIMTAVAAMTALFFLGAAILWRWRPLKNAHAHLFAALFGALVLLNSWLHLWLSRDPLQSTNLMLLTVGVGFFFLSGYWFSLFLVATFALWAGTFYLLSFSLEAAVHFGFGLFSAALLATLAHLARKRALTRLTSLRLRDAQHTAALEQALAAGLESEAALRHSEDGYRKLSIRLEEQAEALRVANEELEQAAQLKDEFLANMSHELRTPLTAILGLTESLREHIYGNLTERQLVAVNNVYESGRHLLDLINDILDVAKLEAGKLQLELVPTDARMIADVSLRFLQQKAESKGLTIHFDDSGIVNTFLADERRVKQMLVNLLSNAVKFTDNGGHIGLRLEGDTDNRIVRYSVWDTGIGISEKQMVQLFEPFVQLDSRLSRQYGGSGLGLVLTYRMAEIHGGSITVESEPGKGSQFTIALPWRTVNQTGAPPADLEHQQPTDRDLAQCKRRPSLLIVDKQLTGSAWIRELMGNEKYDILPASTAADALRLAHEVQPQLIFVDLQLNGSEGIGLIRRMAHDEELKGQAIIAMSARVLPTEAVQAKAAGAHDYFSKPIGYKILHSLLSTVSGKL